METLNETQTQNKNATSLWQTIGMYIGMMVGFLYPQIGLGLGMLLGIALGRLVLTKIPVNTPLAQRAQQKSAIILILAFLILFMNHWYVPCKTCHCSLDELKTNQPNLKDNQMKTTMILIAPRRNPRMLT